MNARNLGYPTAHAALAMSYKLASLLLAALLGVLASRADIAPTTFTGTNVFPLQNSDIRMTSAAVRITWRDPCALTAKFIMTNESAQAQTLEVGFPVGAYHDPQQAYGIGTDEDSKPLLEPVDPAIIRITVNDTAVTAYRRLSAEQIKELGWRYTSWYFAKITFQAGANTVDIRTRLSPSGVSGQPYTRTLAYCISTGGHWKGPIGRETVEIKFPATPMNTVLAEAKPTGGRVDGDSIRWEFIDIEPVGAEYDIALTFTLPHVVALLADMKHAHEQNPDDVQAAIRYATHLFCLGPVKINSGALPRSLSNDDYAAVLSNIENEEDLSLFKRFYPEESHRYVAPKTPWTKETERLIHILADAGFSERYPEYAHVQTARGIMEKCLAENPTNAGVWAVYLAHFWRFSFAARGNFFGSSFYNKPLRRAIETAYKNCATDARIQRWHEAMTKNEPAPNVDVNRTQQIPLAWQNEYGSNR